MQSGIWKLENVQNLIRIQGNLINRQFKDPNKGREKRSWVNQEETIFSQRSGVIDP